MTTDTEDIVAKCPHCGSIDLREVSKVIGTNGIRSWTIDENGRPVPEYDDQGMDVDYDSTEVNDPLNPYQCSECGSDLTEEDIEAAIEKARNNPTNEEDEDELDV